MPLPPKPICSSSKSGLRLLVAFVVGLMSQTGIASAQNLATNPGFETGDTTGWSAFGAGSISAETNYVHSGNYACLVTDRTATWNGIGQSLLGVLQTNQTYNISVWLLLAGGTNQTMALTLEESDASGTSYMWLASGSVSTNGWVQFAGQYTFAPTGTGTSLFLYAEVPSSTNAAYYIDDLDVQPVIAQNSTNGHCVVNWTNVCQPIDGFGFSTAWCGTLTSAKNSALYNTLGLTICRVQIDGLGSDQTANAAAAHAAGAKVLGTEWRVPSQWANTNGELIASNAPAYANWLNNAASTMGLDYVSFQNEPDGANWTPADIYNFVKTNCPAIGKPIAMPECIGFNDSYSDPVINDPAAATNFTILAGHIYGGGLYTHTNALAHGKHVWMTEHYISNVRDSITNSLLMAVEINNCMLAQMSAYVWWWVADWYDDDINLVDVNGNIYKSGATIGQFAKFIRPGYYCLGVTNNGTTSITAYKDPASSSFVIVAANNSTNPANQTFTLTNFPTIGPLRQWVTSATESLGNHGGAIPVTNGAFDTVLPPWTVTTFVYQPPVTNPPAISQQPTSQFTASNCTTMFAVQAAGGTLPLYYQWLFNGTNIISGATNATLVLTGVVPANTGYYSVIITNVAGSVTSSPASLTINSLGWSNATTIAGATDVTTNGTLLYAYNNSGSSATVNGVTFIGVNSYTAWGTGVTLGNGWSATTTSAYAGGSNPPWSNLPGAYQMILQGGAWNNGGVATVTLNNLAVGHQYLVQVWVNDSRSGGTTNRTETLTDAYGNIVTLAYNNTYAQGGVGQYALGTFTASGTNQPFVMNGSASTQLNALQVRDVSPLVPPQFTSIQLAGTNFVLGGNSGNSTNAQYRLLCSTNLLTPQANWIPLATNDFNPDGTFLLTNPVNYAAPQLFFMLRAP